MQIYEMRYWLKKLNECTNRRYEKFFFILSITIDIIVIVGVFMVALMYRDIEQYYYNKIDDYVKIRGYYVDFPISNLTHSNESNVSHTSLNSSIPTIVLLPQDDSPS